MLKITRISWGIGVAVVAAGAAIYASDTRKHVRLPDVPLADGSVLLPNGWTVRPAGRAIALTGDMPLKMAFTADGKKLVVITGGYHDEGVTIINPETEKVLNSGTLGSAWAGLAIDGDNAYVSGGATPAHTLLIGDSLGRGSDFGDRPGRVKGKKASGSYVAGIVANNGTVWVASTNSDEVIRYAGSPLAETGRIKVGYHPYGLALSTDHKSLAVSNWGSESVSVLDPETLTLQSTTPVGAHPNELIYAPDGRLFVANGGANTVSVVKGDKVVETIRTSLRPKDPIGSTPDALALSPDAKTLYVANADNNDVAVVDVSDRESRVRGFIPTGWYPSSLAVSPDGKKLFIGTGKGLRFRANFPAQTAMAQTNYANRSRYDYIGTVLSGDVNVVDVPTGAQLARYTQDVFANTPTPSKVGAAEAMKGLKKIKHVVYVIRENRTYDQEFGDISKGNGDARLTLFNESVTPNAHAIANQFVLLDNTYCNGEVSEDGHQWCDAAYATDFTERAYVRSYSGRGEPTGDERLTASPAGYLWDACRKHGISYLSYGEGSSFTSTPDTPPVFTGTSGLKDHASLAWEQFKDANGNDRDYERVNVFIDDLHKAEQTGNWPQFMVMSLGEDHTAGLSPKAFTPEAAVASNDQGIGKMLDAISHSKFWADTALFIIEDDAQNGPDHVDAHRTVAMVASPYTRRGIVDSTHYTTASMVRTIELILGLPPMTQFDAKATPMYASFMATPDLTPFSLVDPRIALDTRNPERGPLAEISKTMDFSGYDRADPDKLNYVLWAALKPGQPMPAPVRSIDSN